MSGVRRRLMTLGVLLVALLGLHFVAWAGLGMALVCVLFGVARRQRQRWFERVAHDANVWYGMHETIYVSSLDPLDYLLSTEVDRKHEGTGRVSA